MPQAFISIVCISYEIYTVDIDKHEITTTTNCLTTKSQKQPAELAVNRSRKQLMSYLTLTNCVWARQTPEPKAIGNQRANPTQLYILYYLYMQ